MGWWSEGILGGDSPLDDLGEIADLCGCASYDLDEEIPDYEGYHSQYAFSAEKLNAQMDELQRRAEKDLIDGWNVGVFGQVLGFLIVRYGASMSDAMRAILVKACDVDEWAAEEGEGSARWDNIDTLREAVRNYVPGEAQKLDPGAALFESLLKAV